MIIDLQRRITEAGRIRTGLQVEFERQDGSTGTRPAKLDTFRFTSADRRRIEQIAQLYGGEVRPWKAPAGDQWEVVSERAEIDVIVPPSELAFSQHYELWSAGGCARRCDGATEQISDGPCLCDPEARECDIHTRLSVLLRDIPGLGVWRVDTQGWYAATELQGAVEIIGIAAGQGRLLPARLRLDQRAVKRPDKNGRVQTLRFAVPVLDVEVTSGQLLAGGQGAPLQIAAGDPPARPPLTPVPQIAAPVPSIAEQSAPPAERTRRANAAAEIPASGRRRAAHSAPIEPAEGEAAPAPARRSTPRRSAPAAEPEAPPPPSPISYDELRRRILASELELEVVAAAVKRRFPNGPTTKGMTDEQRGRLWAELERASVAAPPPAQQASTAGAQATGLRLEALTDALRARGIAFQWAEAVARQDFGIERLDALTDEQRGQLLERLLADVVDEEETDGDAA